MEPQQIPKEELMHIVIADAFAPDLPARLEQFGTVSEGLDELANADVLLIRSKTKCTPEFLDQAPNLKLIIRGGVGLDNVDRPYAESKGIRVHNTPKASAIAVAELAFALMIAVPNHIVRGHNSMAEGEWIKKQLKRTELFGKTLGLVGIGNIATEVAKRGAAFGMTVKAYDKYVNQSDHAEMVGSLEELVDGADYVSLHLPLTDETRGMINSDIIAKMKDGATMVNTGRGLTADADAVVAALESGKLGAYATDVWPSDPPAPDYPILKAPNVVMTPHLGASSKENLGRIGDEVMNLITAFLAEVKS